MGEGEPDYFDVERFNYDEPGVAGREFDVVLFWTPPTICSSPLLAPVLNHIQQVDGA